jgi:ribonuclease HI
MPRIGWLKCNIDEAFFVDWRRILIGACSRNSSNDFTVRLTQWQQLALSTKGEAWALLQAMNEAKHRGFEWVQFESDSQVLVEAIRTKRQDNSDCSYYVIICKLW